MSESVVKGKRLGWVAEFCAICRELRPTELRTAIAVRGGTESSVRGLTCGDCGFERWTQSWVYTAAVPDTQDGLEDLIRRTNPNVRQLYAARLELEELVKDGNLDDEDRRLALREPVELLAPGINDPPGDVWLGYCIMAGFGIFLVFLIASAFAPRSAIWVSVTGLTSLLAALGAMLLGILFIPFRKPLWRKRYLRKHAYPMLARALRPLNPDPAELRSMIEGMRSLGIQAARHVDSEVLHAAIAKARNAILG